MVVKNDSKIKIEDSLRKVPLFSEFGKDELSLVKSYCSEVSFPAGATILEENSQGGDLFIMLSGVAGIILSDDGREFLLDELKKGEFFGELALLDGKCRSAAVVAQSDVRCLVLKRESFLKAVAKSPGMAVKLLSVMARRLRGADEKIKMLSFLDVAGRLEKAVVDIGATRGVRTPDGGIRISGITHQALANRVGASREAVTKAIKTLASNKRIEVKGKEILIPANTLKYGENYLDNIRDVNYYTVKKT